MTFSVLRPFIYTLVFAGVFAILFQPLQRRVLVLTKQNHGISAAITTFLIVIFIFTPLLLLGIQLYQEALQLYSVVSDLTYRQNFLEIFKIWINSFQVHFSNSNIFTFDMQSYVKQGLSWVMQNFGSIFSSVAGLMGNFFIFIIALYYLLKDGQRFKIAILNLSPLDDKDDELVIEKIALAINSVIKGRLLIALLQGVLMAVGFVIFGVPNAVLWGSISVLAALIPGIGTALVIVPTTIFLLIGNHVVSAIGFMLWGSVIVGLVDNLLGPKLMSRGVQLHPFIIFLSVLGGIIVFGPVGLLLGPIVISLLFALLDIYLMQFKAADRKS